MSAWLPSPGDTFSDKVGVTELDETLLNSILNSWSKPAYVQGFDFETIMLKDFVNIFEQMDISESS